MQHLATPIPEDAIAALHVGDTIEISGWILCGRDAVLPKVVAMVRDGTAGQLGVDLRGQVVFHTAVSPAGVGPTSSNKVEIEDSIPGLSVGGVAMHLGKGALKPETVKAMAENGSCFAVTPPTTAYFSHSTVSQKVLAFPEEGMEALYEIEVTELPVIIAAVNGETMFAK